MSYDSTAATRAHIARVRELLMKAINDLNSRYWKHDASKLQEPEKSMFDDFTEKLGTLAYGTPEYEACRQEMLVDGALKHHYEHNDHHPEHRDGTLGWMNFIQLIELLADWKAAGERHADGGDLGRSIETNQERFGYSDETKGFMINTAEYLGWT